jgi:hypothetical protein
MPRERVPVEPAADFAQLQLTFGDQMPWRYEVMRPLVLCADRTVTQRAQATQTHPDTVRTLQRRCRQQGMVGLLPHAVKGEGRGRASRVPEAVREEIDRLKALEGGFHDRELARLGCCQCGIRRGDKTVKKLWQASPGHTPQPLAWGD